MKERMLPLIQILEGMAKGNDIQLIRMGDLAEELRPLGEALNQVLRKFVSPGEKTHVDERLQSVFDRMREAYVETDLTGRIRFFNPSLVRNSGYEREELMGMSFDQLIDEKDVPWVVRKVLHVISTGQPCRDLEFTARRKDGSLFPVVAHVDLVYGADGSPDGIFGTLRDLSPVIQAERERVRLEKHYREVLDALDEAYLECDLRGNITYVNDTACRILRLRREEFIGQNFRQFLPPTSAKKLRKIFGDIYETGKPAMFVDFPAILEGNEERIFEIKAALLKDDEGKPIGFRILTSDVTEYRKTQHALMESEQKYRMIVENMSESIWTMDLNLRHTYQSPSEVKMTGYTPEEILQVPIEQMLPPASLERAWDVLTRALEAEREGKTVPQEPYKMEIQVRRKDGSLIWEEVAATFQRDEEGKPIGLLCVARDITDRKRLEEEHEHVRRALEESEKKLRLIIDNLGEAIWLFDLDLTNEEMISPGDLAVTGYTPEEIYAMPINEFLLPDSFELGMKVLEEELAKEQSGEPIDPIRTRTLEVKLRRKEGGFIWYEIKARFLRDENGKPTKILLVGRNITDRKQAEEALENSERKYRMIVENMYESVWSLSLDLKTKNYISPSEVSMTGYTPDEIVDMPLEELVLPDSLELGKQILAEELAREEIGEVVDPNRSRTFEIKLKHKDGHIVWEEVTATFERDKEGRPTGILLVGRDITERKKAEEERERLERQLIQAQKMESVGRLAGGIAHDFNNVLAVILGTVDVLKIKLPPIDALFSTVKEIEQAALRARDITAQLLAFSRKQVAEPRVIKINSVIERMAKNLSRLIGEDISISYHLDPTLWPVKIDPIQVEQVVMNIVVNARDAMPEGGRLTIETTNVVLDDEYCQQHLGFRAGEYALLSISDNGTGIPPDVLPYIFDPYFTTKEPDRGTGLGLATVYGIVKQNEGYVNVYSELGQGTTVKIYLPRSREEVKEEERVKEPISLQAPYRVLVVEDDEAVLDITVQMLKLLGCDTWAFSSPEKALKFLLQSGREVDIVITDVIMPGMTGKELMERVKQVRPEASFIFMSGYTANVIAHHGILEEGIIYLQKPFTIVDLSARLSQAMNQG
ncbi:MAG: PAS domain S-box protein [Syntrophales bacterium]|nr:PAS domain S-box protein [Syntrophales bacterium]